MSMPQETPQDPVWEEFYLYEQRPVNPDTASSLGNVGTLFEKYASRKEPPEPLFGMPSGESETDEAQNNRQEQPEAPKPVDIPPLTLADVRAKLDHHNSSMPSTRLTALLDLALGENYNNIVYSVPPRLVPYMPKHGFDAWLMTGHQEKEKVVTNWQKCMSLSGKSRKTKYTPLHDLIEDTETLESEGWPCLQRAIHIQRLQPFNPEAEMTEIAMRMILREAQTAADDAEYEARRSGE